MGIFLSDGFSQTFQKLKIYYRTPEANHLGVLLSLFLLVFRIRDVLIRMRIRRSYHWLWDLVSAFFSRYQ
jgi:hypothetical protein